MTGTRDRIVVVGSGLAALTTALSLAPLPVLLLTDGPLGTGGSSPWAQGGIAAALGPDDAPALHAADTMAAGDGLCDPETVEIVANDAPDCIAELRRLGAPLDLDDDGRPALTLEAAHSRHRVVHAGGDRSGLAIVETLCAAVRATPSITIMEHVRASDLLVRDGRVSGIAVERAGAIVAIPARAVVLATGGASAIYAATTNQPGTWGSGLAMAARAGAVLRDIEFVQFHPTAIALPALWQRGASLPLASEALRGEGAKLVDATGMSVVDHLDGAELAPRDQVARAVFAAIAAGRPVFLDARDAIGARFPVRFPAITEFCRDAGIDPVRQVIPVRPAAHYHMGGIRVDAVGRSSLPGLRAVGEVAATGLHGANRLASNSLLETLVFGRRVAADLKSSLGRSGHGIARDLRPVMPANRGADDAAAILELRQRMDRDVGVLRDGIALDAAAHAFADMRTLGGTAGRMADMALMLAVAALRRTESRGGHCRTDFPGHAAARGEHQDITLDQAIEAVAPGTPSLFEGLRA
ncbi:MAG: L-aspartate oxidase [Pseudomonadota bacterium]|nr:L-aspartate oxidase [Pseudomonadota bacterium]